jgi:hypothetical protein
MNHRGLLAAAAGAVFLLAGCDKSPVGASATNGTAGEVSQSSSLSRTKQLTHSDSGTAVISMGAQALIIQTLTKDLDFSARQRAHALADGTVRTIFSKIVDGRMLKEETEGRAKLSPDDLKKRLKDQADQLGYFGDVSTPQQTVLAAARLHAVLAVASVSAPSVGWFDDVCHLMKGVSPSCSAWMNGMRADAALANALETTIAAQLKNVVLADPAAAQKQILAVLKSIDIVALIQQYAVEVYNDGAHNTVDMGGAAPAPVHFISSDGNDYQIGPGGMAVLKAGTPWFGGGYLSGMKYELGLESLISKTTTKETTDQQGQGTAATTGNEAKAGTN